MSRVFQTDINTNLHNDFFEFKHPTMPKVKTEESVSKRNLKWSSIDQHYGDYPMHDDKSRNNYASKALAGIQEVSPFSLLYFSLDNIKEVQRLIRYNVYIHTDKKYVIDEQDETELVIIMRGVYLQYAKVQNEENKFQGEIERLNGLVVTELLPNLVSNIEQYVGYIKDSTQMYIPMDRGTNPSIKGEKILRSITDILIGDKKFFE